MRLHLYVVLVIGFAQIIRLSSAHAVTDAENLIKGEALYQTYHFAPGRLQEAITIFEAVLVNQPESYFVLWKLAEMYASFGETLPEEQKKTKFALWKTGAAYAERAIKVNPKAREGHFFYVANQGTMAKHETVFTSVWKLRRVRKEIGIALKLDPKYAPAVMAQANFLVSVPGFLGGDEREAMQLYEKVLRLDPSYIAAHYFMAELDYENKRYDSAIRHLKQVIECKKPWHIGNYTKVILPWSNHLLKQALRKKNGD
ncbi:MAG: tetratricopeptide repeat protein [Proteobacteria bacterium]|nr:tetratricopeptide repeat protein [Pseudomonadota bacterium]